MHDAHDGLRDCDHDGLKCHQVRAKQLEPRFGRILAGTVGSGKEGQVGNCD